MNYCPQCGTETWVGRGLCDECLGADREALIQFQSDMMGLDDGPTELV